MVEGPGCTLNGERLRKGGIIGQIVKLVVSKHADMQTLQGLQVNDVVTLGKELFLFLAPPPPASCSLLRQQQQDFSSEALGVISGVVCVRLHFGMNGSLTFNAKERYKKPIENIVFQLHFSRDIVSVYQSTVCLRCPRRTRQLIDKLARQDVCSPSFDVAAASAALLAHARRHSAKEALLVDALLDQTILPGSGNIIKNEALFLAKVYPFLPSSSLTQAQAVALVAHVRDFSLLFKRCRESGQSLSKHCNVYNRRACGSCGSMVRVCRAGNDLARVTFCCTSCQPSPPEEASAAPSASLLLQRSIHAAEMLCAMSSCGKDSGCTPPPLPKRPLAGEHAGGTS
jgi:endonuclease VIII-like 3